MDPQGGKTRTKKNVIEQEESGMGRMPKRPRGSHPGLVIEPSTGLIPRHKQTTLLDLRMISASTSSTPTDPSATSRPGVSTPVESNHYQSSHTDEATEPSDDEGLSGEDVDATTSDIVSESSG
ncbi:hypothetical protein LIER_34173 [Lithospermum erythrorhizon]|uniref:Uncharacterized protein n=1 Tax=Lithospermum erythrorhizon TaxID=34254 RepID=A0AAV3S1T1_LITER